MSLIKIMMFSIILIIPIMSFGQDETPYDFTFELNPSYTFITVSQDEFRNTDKLIDFDKHFDRDWIGDFDSVMIHIFKNNELKIIEAPNDIITDEIRQELLYADSGKRIKVSFDFMPDNAIKNNTLKSDGFSFTILPDHFASFPGGKDDLNKYFSNTVLNKIDKDDIEVFNIAAVKFRIDEDGYINNSHIVSSSKSPYIDSLLLEAVCDMPAWNYAHYKDGTKVAQDFVFSIGDHTSCVLNTLDVKRSAPQAY